MMAATSPATPPIAEICEALQLIHNPATPNAKRAECSAFLETIKASPNVLQTASALFHAFPHGNLAIFVKNFSFLLLEEIVKYRWSLIDQAQKDAVKRELERMFVSMQADDSHLRLKFAYVVALVAVREWPHNWEALTALFRNRPAHAVTCRAYEVLCCIAVEISYEAFGSGSNAAVCDDERKKELAEAMNAVARFLVPELAAAFCATVAAETPDTAFIGVSLGVFAACFTWCDADLFLAANVPLIASLVACLDLASKGVHLKESALLAAVEVLAAIFGRSYAADVVDRLAVFLPQLDRLASVLKQFYAAPQLRALFLGLCVVLSDFGTNQLFDGKVFISPSASSVVSVDHVAAYFKLMLYLTELQPMQIHALVVRIWPSFLRHSYWAKNAALYQAIASQLIGILVRFSAAEQKALFAVSRDFALNDLSIAEYEVLHSRALVAYADAMQAISRRLPVDVANFMLPAALEAAGVDSPAEFEWTKTAEKRAESLVFFVEQLTRALVTDGCVFDRAQMDEFLVFVMRRLCASTATAAEPIFFQLSLVASCLRYLQAFSVTAFAFGELYTKLFHLIYEFQDSNSAYKHRVKERIFAILNCITQSISHADAAMFIKYGLEISASGYVFPEMNTVLVDFLFNISRRILSSDAANTTDAAMRTDVLNLVAFHIKEAADNLAFRCSVQHFLSSIGFFLALQKFSATKKPLNAVKFLEGDLKPCHEFSGSLSKLQTLLQRLLACNDLPLPFVNSCLDCVLPRLFAFVGFLQQFPAAAEKLQRLSFVFMAPLNNFVAPLDKFGIRSQTTESTLESYFNRFSSWFDGAKKSTYSLISIIFQIDSFYQRADVLQAFVQTFSLANFTDVYQLSGVIEWIFVRFVKTSPLPIFVDFYACFLRQAIDDIVAKTAQEWARLEAAGGIIAGSDAGCGDDAEDEDGGDGEIDVDRIRFKSLVSLTKSILKLLSVSFDALLTANRLHENFAVYFAHFIAGISFKDNACRVANFELFSKVLVSAKANGILVQCDAATQSLFEQTVMTCVSGLKVARDGQTRDSFVHFLTNFIYEMHPIVDFFDWINRPEDAFLQNAKSKFAARTNPKSKKDIVKSLVRHVFDATLAAKSLDSAGSSPNAKRVSTLTQKLAAIEKPKASHVTQDAAFSDNTDYGLSMLFE